MGPPIVSRGSIVQIWIIQIQTTRQTESPAHTGCNLEFLQRSGVQPPERLTSLGITGEHDYIPHETPWTSQLYGTEGFEKGPQLVPHFVQNSRSNFFRYSSALHASIDLRFCSNLMDYGCINSFPFGLKQTVILASFKIKWKLFM